MFWKINYFIQDFLKDKNPQKILDVGSRNINGSVKDSLREAHKVYEKFIGVDMIDGNGVDIVMNAHDLDKKFEPNTFDLVTCCETFEHDNKFWITLEQMKKVLKPGGYLLITVPGLYFIEHNYPSDYYRFTKAVFEEVFFEGMENIYVEEFIDPNDPTPMKPNNSLFGYAKKI